MSDSPGLVAAMWLLDARKLQGFRFRRIAPGPNGPLRGEAIGVCWRPVFHAEMRGWRTRWQKATWPVPG